MGGDRMGRTPDRETAVLLQNLSNTLLNALNDSMAAADLLARRMAKGDHTEELRYLAMLRHDQHRMLRVAENMSELASIELGEAVADGRVLDLNALCGELCRTVALLTGGEKPAPEFQPCPGIAPVLGDAAKLELMLLNLLTNSLQHCSAEDSIRLSVSRLEEQICITLEDSGSGVAAEAMPTVFEDYLRKLEVPEAGRGAGLGLGVAAGIAENHGGSLLITALPEGGTRVVVRLPANSALQLRETGEPYGRGMRRVLTALSEILSFEKYAAPFL